MTARLENLEAAASLEKAGKWSDLLAFAQLWSKEEPKNLFAWQAIGDASRKLNRPQDALLAYREALGIAPPIPTLVLGATVSAAPIWYRIGHAHFELGNVEDAVKAFEEVGRIDPGVPDIWNDLGVVHMNNRNTKGAFEAFKKAVIADPRNLNGLKNLGLLYAMTGARQGVENTHERMLAIDGMAARVFLGQANKILNAG